MLTDLDKLKESLSYNPLTGEFVWSRTLGGSVIKGRAAGSLDKDGYQIIRWKRRTYRGGRLAWWFVHCVWPPHQIDHINRIRNDDRIANLRPATRVENAINKGRYKKKHPYPPGVYFKNDVPRSKPWFSVLTRDGKTHLIGSFFTMQEASVAYQTARLAASGAQEAA